jgi:spermidine synthase
MTDAPARSAGAEWATGASLPIVAAFAATLFLSAFLLFSVQPLFAKLALPLLGGAPAVWSVAMVFFQATLLAGYAYAHTLIRFAGRFGVVIHVALMALALLWLPIALASGFESPPQSNLSIWVLALFTASLGVPLLAVTANAPLLQAWFARTRHNGAGDPYFLYGASNVGSLIALLSYPFLIEPRLTLNTQSLAWSAGYVVLFAAVALCGASVRTGRNAVAAAVAARPKMRARVEWAAFGFLPSALLVATTAHISTNIAAAPFLWVMPLAIFLLSFVVTFTRRPVLPVRGMQVLLPIALPAAMATVLFPGVLGGLPGIAVNLFAFFVIAVCWHAELYARRPSASRLTDFYLCMSVGGVLGGAFTSLVAPVVFSSVLEFPFLLGASVLAIPEMRALIMRRRALTAVGGAVAVAFVIVMSPDIEHRQRNFFGVVSTKISDDGRYRLLIHGTTVHGAQKLESVNAPPSAGRPEPLLYYGAGAPLAEGIAIARRAKAALSVGVVGLGAGSLACYAEPGDRWRFFEINPAVTEIARDRRYFSFLARCAPDVPVLGGDARLTLRDEADGSYDVLVIDAFSSDAIPVHLITAEALRLYARKVGPDGIVLLHISNLHLELGSVVAATAEAEGLAGAWRDHRRSREEFLQTYKSPSQVVALARNAAALDAFVTAGWERLAADGSVAPWTDDYSNIVGAMLRMQGLMPTPAISVPSPEAE